MRISHLILNIIKYIEYFNELSKTQIIVLFYKTVEGNK